MSKVHGALEVEPQVAKFVALTRQSPLRTHKLEQIRLL
jgi:hypothetical protein